MKDKIKEFISNNSWFDIRFKEGLSLGKRFHTMKAALTLFLARGGQTIVETGCQRLEDDWGAGCSTEVFSEFICHYGIGKMYSIDNNQENINFAAELTNPEVTEFICEDSVIALQKFRYPMIDLLYLDSYDYPYEELLDEFGRQDDLDLAIERIHNVSDDYIVQHFIDIIKPSQEHQVKELEAAEDKLHENSIILLDDYDLPGGGKCRLSHEWLLDHDWKPILTSYQSLWI